MSGVQPCCCSRFSSSPPSFSPSVLWSDAGRPSRSRHRPSRPPSGPKLLLTSKRHALNNHTRSWHSYLSPCCLGLHVSEAVSPRLARASLTPNPSFFPEKKFLWHATCSIFCRQARSSNRDPAANTSLSAACRCASRPPSDPSVKLSETRTRSKRPGSPSFTRLFSKTTENQAPFVNLCQPPRKPQQYNRLTACDEICHFHSDVFCRILPSGKRFATLKPRKRGLACEADKFLASFL